jgi:hypothetical protein
MRPTQSATTWSTPRRGSRARQLMHSPERPVRLGAHFASKHRGTSPGATCRHCCRAQAATGPTSPAVQTAPGVGSAGRRYAFGSWLAVARVSACQSSSSQISWTQSRSSGSAASEATTGAVRCSAYGTAPTASPALNVATRSSPRVASRGLAPVDAAGGDAGAAADTDAAAAPPAPTCPWDGPSPRHRTPCQASAVVISTSEATCECIRRREV